MIQLYILRHGETDWNLTGKLQGWTDVSLNETGKSQAKALAERLRSIDFISCVSSDLSRAKETALLATEGRYNIIEDQRFREIFCGVWEGQSIESLRKNNEHIDLYYTDPLNNPPRDGETTQALFHRCSEAVEELITTHKNQGGNILITSHGGAIRTLISYLIGVGIEASNSFQINNCGIARILIEDSGRRRLLSLNE